MTTKPTQETPIVSPLRRPARLNLITGTLLAVGLLNGCTQGPAITADKSPRPVVAMQLTDAQSHYSLSYSAVLAPQRQAELAFRVPGPVAEIRVSEGQAVKAGDVLMQLDPHDFNVRITEHRARVREAKAAAEQAKRTRERQRAAMTDSAMAKVELDRADAEVSRTQAAITVAEQHLQVALDAKRYSIITAPYDGIVARIDIEPHEQVLPQKAVMALYDPAHYEVRFDVPADQARGIRVGQGGRFDLDDDPYAVEISEIERTTASRASAHTVVAQLQQAPEGAWPELSGRIRLEHALNQSAFAVPGSALAGLGKDLHLVRVEDNQAHWVPVQSVGFDGQQVLVTGELNPGDRLVIQGAAYLDDGEVVGDVRLDHDAKNNKVKSPQ